MNDIALKLQEMVAARAAELLVEHDSMVERWNKICDDLVKAFGDVPRHLKTLRKGSGCWGPELYFWWEGKRHPSVGESGVEMRPANQEKGTWGRPRPKIIVIRCSGFNFLDDEYYFDDEKSIAKFLNDFANGMAEAIADNTRRQKK